MSYTQITDHDAQALARLAYQFESSTNLRALVSAGASGVQTVEDALWELYSERLLDGAVGAQLDSIGAVIGQAREASTDDEYRARLRGRILANRSDNSVEALLGIARAVLDDPAAVAVLTPYAPAAFVLTVPDAAVDDDTAGALADMIHDARAAGVNGQVVSSTEPADDTFAFQDPAGFLAAGILAGVGTLTITGDATTFPASGGLKLDEGTTVEENVTYTSRTGSTFTLSGVTVNAHAERGLVATNPDNDGGALGNSSDPAEGGVFAGVREA